MCVRLSRSASTSRRRGACAQVRVASGPACVERARSLAAARRLTARRCWRNTFTSQLAFLQRACFIVRNRRTRNEEGEPRGVSEAASRTQPIIKSRHVRAGTALAAAALCVR